MKEVSFDYKRIAKGYAKDRPYLHARFMERLRGNLDLDKNFQNGLDIGCGAGLSSQALKEICDNVTCADVSEEMVQAAKAMYPQEGYCFVKSRAEEVEAARKRQVF